MGLKINIEKKEEGYYVVSLEGSIDSDTFVEFEKKIKSILNSSTTAIMLNMEGVTYISSIGFGVIFRTKQALEQNKGSLAIANIKPNVKRIFEAVKVIPELLFATLEAADEYLDKYIQWIDTEGKEKEEKK